MKRARWISIAVACLQALVPAGTFIAAGSGRPLVAQVLNGWVPLAFDSGVSADVRVKVQSIPGGYQIFFKNFGKATAHFGYYLEGIQTQDAVPANGRIHLKAGNVLGPFIIQSGISLRVRAVDTASGDEDVPPSSASAS